jgi:16S rRNA (adenine1518-N6/adenine1519-N6)-dimethyltransferase
MKDQFQRDRDEGRWAQAWDYIQSPTPPPSSPREIRQLLQRYGLHARKGLGQNFLVDRDVLARIVHAADLKPTDAVVEVGPGLGVLTRELAQRAARLVAVELDPGLVRVLRDQLQGLPNAEVVQADILKFDHVAYLAGRPYKVVANLPYYITSPTIRHFLEAKVQPTLLVLLVQKEVAERIAARPGEMSLLAVSVQFYGDPSIVSFVPASAFVPQPKVDSAILRIDVYDRPVADISPEQFFKVVSAGFSQPRKQLHNAIQQGMWLPPSGAINALREAGIDEKRRAETLDVDEWASLCRAMIKLGYLKP